ncbi:Hypothetical protein NTJ_03428 [Nesidiocoris tenuis]|uniref:Uncharacterized protein n=1 Tax=Nesidiocoris tenuis TaxID=355587 RepID=A0ABN7AEA8_9HEMI|nr:Hypothetical protein NTJ_03428 [Nesidiocoris tenuis]
MPDRVGAYERGYKGMVAEPPSSWVIADIAATANVTGFPVKALGAGSGHYTIVNSPPSIPVLANDSRSARSLPPTHPTTMLPTQQQPTRWYLFQPANCQFHLPQSYCPTAPAIPLPLFPDNPRQRID